jgi:hypothetical protein
MTACVSTISKTNGPREALKAEAELLRPSVPNATFALTLLAFERINSADVRAYKQVLERATLTDADIATARGAVLKALLAADGAVEAPLRELARQVLALTPSSQAATIDLKKTSLGAQPRRIGVSSRFMRYANEKEMGVLADFMQESASITADWPLGAQMTIAVTGDHGGYADDDTLRLTAKAACACGHDRKDFSREFEIGYWDSKLDLAEQLVAARDFFTRAFALAVRLEGSLTEA